MRFRRVDLRAFGPFTDVVLDLSAEGVLHVVHGENEAGKSTALRALTDFLYGIPERTRDDHLHRKDRLRIGAVIERADGKRLELVRRKGRKNTLLDAAGEPVDEAVLRAALGGVGRDLFETVFGLSQASLRSGGRALLEGRGDVGESLFDAGVGGSGIHAVLERLEREADELFTPRSKQRKLDQAIAAFKEARKAVAHTGLSSAAWQTQREEVERTRAARDALDARLGELLREHTRIQRHVRVIPKLDQRATLRAQRAELGEVPRLPEDATARRVEALRTREECERAIADLERHIARLEERREALEIPASLVDLPDATVKDLADRLAAHRKAASDLPRREAELAAAEQDVAAILRRLGRDPTSGLEQLRLGSGRINQIHALANRYSGLEEALRGAREMLGERQEELACVRQRLEAAGGAPDTGPLARAVEAAQRLGDVDERLEAGRRAVERDARTLEERLAALSPWRGSPGELLGLALPSPETIDRFEAEAVEMARARERLEERAAAIAARVREATRDLEALEAGGEVPSEEQLAEARRRRGELWARIVQGADPAGPEGEAFDAAVQRADGVADRLRREAERVAKHAQIVADLHACEREREELDAERASIGRRAAEHADAWRALFAPLGIDAPLPPGEMRAWLRRVGEAQAAAEALRESEEKLRVQEGQARARRAALLDALAALGEADGDTEGPVGPLLDRATSVLEDARRRAEERRALEERAAGLEQEVRAHARRVERREADLAAWRREWAASVTELGLGEDPAVEAVIAVLEDLGELFRRADAATELRRRIEGMHADAERLARDATAIVERHLPEVAERSLEERIEELVRRHGRMRHHLDQRASIDEDLEERRSAFEMRRRERERAEAQLVELMSLAGVENVDELMKAEERARQARELEARIRDTEEQLVELGDGLTVEALVEETRDVDLLEASKRSTVIEDEIESVKEKLAATSRELGTKEQELESLRRRSAAEAADDAQAELAALRALARRYARLRLSAAILRREIDRYRDRHQGPILARARELFPRLTLGSFDALRVVFEDADRPVLVCVRPDGTEVDVEGLSNGTRDQLYLSLRLATIEHHAEHGDPMPLVLDDVLSDFDERRTHAALEVLAEVARTTQVILFTHHAWVVEAARHAAGGRVVTHDLDAARAPARSRPEAPP